jgi:hypothetical protein
MSLSTAGETLLATVGIRWFVFPLQQASTRLARCESVKMAYGTCANARSVSEPKAAIGHSLPRLSLCRLRRYLSGSQKRSLHPVAP